MQYSGTLYARIGGKYLPCEMTAAQVDEAVAKNAALRKRVKRMEEALVHLRDAKVLRDTAANIARDALKEE